MSDEALSNKLYPDAYGKYSGRPEGTKPDYSRCCEAVVTDSMFAVERQCARKRGFGPDKAYCKQHDPEAQKARREKARANDVEKFNKQRFHWHGRKFFNVLVDIANGHNDPRGLASATIKHFRDGEQK